MVSEQWKAIERFVAKLLGGTRTFDTDIDVMLIVDPGIFSVDELTEMSGPEIQRHSKAGRLEAWAVEVKNRQDLSIPMIERFLEHNRAKAARFRMRNAMVVKRKAGSGIPTPYLLIIPLETNGEHA